MKAALLGSLVASAGAYVACALSGYLGPMSSGPDLTPPEAAAALAFAFPEAGAVAGSWHLASGHASHGWLFRRAYVTGRAGSAAGVTCSEQVLKVGWPFTVVRGFVRRVGDEVRPEGARLIGPADGSGVGRLLPTQPVWPGVIFFGLVGALGGVVTSRTSRR